MNHRCRRPSAVIVRTFLVCFPVEWAAPASLAQDASVSNGRQSFPGTGCYTQLTPGSAGAPRGLPDSWLEAHRSSTKFWIHLCSQGSHHAASNDRTLAICLPAGPPVTAGASDPTENVAVRKPSPTQHQDNGGPAGTVQGHRLPPPAVGGKTGVDRTKARECSRPQRLRNCHPACGGPAWGWLPGTKASLGGSLPGWSAISVGLRTSDRNRRPCSDLSARGCPHPRLGDWLGS